MAVSHVLNAQLFGELKFKHTAMATTFQRLISMPKRARSSPPGQSKVPGCSSDNRYPKSKNSIN